MKTLPDLLEKNKEWARQTEVKTPGYFQHLSVQQNPKFLWIGCSDSRVPANTICGLEPGEVFVHRNVANLVVHTDFNCLAVLQYAVDVLKVEHVIVCGHYGCGGVRAALTSDRFGLIDNWICNIKDVHALHEHQFKNLDLVEKENLLCELNVRHQVLNLKKTNILQDAWKRNQEVNVHGWIYGLKDGLLKDLEI